ncbi:hypothetical protein IPM62_00930 [Candidatus Woesebacteria bacterium]|nr:MAG: hypothetical protein IPM62_00930 [Candidatus Woesebacteria bacterium]
MEESSEPVSPKQTIGADANAWKRRVREFVNEPERRKAMLTKFIRLTKSRIKTEANLDSKIHLSYIDDDQSGMESYHFSTNELIFCLGVSIVPTDATFREVSGQKCFAYSKAHELKKEDRTNYHLILNPTVADISSPEETPYLGLARDGKLIKDFSPPTKGLENFAGGFSMVNGGFNILPLDELKQQINDGKNAEQTMFVANNKNWANLADSDNFRELKNDWNAMGYFLDMNNQKRYFVIESKNQAGIQGIKGGLKALDEIREKKGYASWHIAGLDIGGGFSAMLQDVDNGAQTIKGPSVLVKADLLKNEARIDEVGHKRSRFFVFQWPRERI